MWQAYELLQFLGMESALSLQLKTYLSLLLSSGINPFLSIPTKGIFIFYQISTYDTLSLRNRHWYVDTHVKMLLGSFACVQCPWGE